MLIDLCISHAASPRSLSLPAQMHDPRAGPERASAACRESGRDSSNNNSNNDSNNNNNSNNNSNNNNNSTSIITK